VCSKCMTLQHCDVLSLLVCAAEQVHGVTLSGILVSETRGKYRETPLDTLDADAALFARHRQLSNLCTADSLSDQVRAPVATEDLNDLLLGLPQERILQLDSLVQNDRKQPLKRSEDADVSCGWHVPRVRDLR
jgi:hypothetical protein